MKFRPFLAVPTFSNDKRHFSGGWRGAWLLDGSFQQQWPRANEAHQVCWEDDGSRDPPEENFNEEKTANGSAEVFREKDGTRLIGQLGQVVFSTGLHGTIRFRLLQFATPWLFYQWRWDFHDSSFQASVEKLECAHKAKRYPSSKLTWKWLEMETHRFLIGDTSWFMVVFPASHDSLFKPFQGCNAFRKPLLRGTAWIIISVDAKEIRHQNQPEPKIVGRFFRLPENCCSPGFLNKSRGMDTITEVNLKKFVVNGRFQSPSRSSVLKPIPSPKFQDHYPPLKLTVCP